MFLSKLMFVLFAITATRITSGDFQDNFDEIFAAIESFELEEILFETKIKKKPIRKKQSLTLRHQIIYTKMINITTPFDSEQKTALNVIGTHSIDEKLNIPYGYYWNRKDKYKIDGNTFSYYHLRATSTHKDFPPLYLQLWKLERKEKDFIVYLVNKRDTKNQSSYDHSETVKEMHELAKKYNIQID